MIKIRRVQILYDLGDYPSDSSKYAAIHSSPTSDCKPPVILYIAHTEIDAILFIGS